MPKPGNRSTEEPLDALGAAVKQIGGPTPFEQLPLPEPPTPEPEPTTKEGK